MVQYNVNSAILNSLINRIMRMHRAEYSNMVVDHCGASIDAVAVIQKLVTHDRYRGNATAGKLMIEIAELFPECVLKYAKPLSKHTQSRAYHLVKSAVNGELNVADDQE